MNDKDEILKLLKENPVDFVNDVTGMSDLNASNSIIREFKELDRKIRKTQVGNVQKRKRIGKGNAQRYVDPVRIPIPFQNKIVKNGTAFEVGEPVTLVPNNNNSLWSEISRLWERNRMESVIQDVVSMRKSQKESAALFYIKDTAKGQSYNRIRGVNKDREIKTKVLDSDNGFMKPIFDIDGDMILFIWKFSVEDFKGKESIYTWIYDEDNIYKLQQLSGEKPEYMGEEKHGFDRIPIALTQQDKVEWFEAEAMIDRLEVTLSKLGASNDYSGHPILKLYGEVKGGGLDKEEDGKSLRMSVERDSQGKLISGDAKFLTHDNAPQSVEIEMNKLEKYIYSMTSTADITFHNIKGLGSISGYAIELMFMDSIIKAKTNNTKYNKPFIERCINILISGIVTNLKASLRSEAEDMIIDVKFNTILPKDLDRSVQTYMNGVTSGIISVPTAVRNLDVADDIDGEIEILRSVTEEDNKVDVNNLP